jgi:hypothetical protein
MTGYNFCRLRPEVLAVLLVALIGCGSSELTRGKAEKIISASKAFSEANQHALYTLDGDDIEKGIRAGFWKKQPGFFGESLILTPAGQKLFATLGSQGFGQGIAVTTSALTKRRLVDITGITEAPALLSGGGTPDTVKAVEFTWLWDSNPFPGEVKAFFKDPKVGSATALLRRYDDGWRFMSME